MRKRYVPHVLGIDDGPLDKHPDATVPLVAVMMEGAAIVESVAVAEFPVDGDGINDFLSVWIASMRCSDALQAIVLGGITIAGLSVVDIEALHRSCGVPVIVVNRKEPLDTRLEEALRAAGLAERIAVVAASPAAFRLDDGLYVAAAGATAAQATRMVDATRAKSLLPEPLRVAHLIGAALVNGQSRGRA